MQIVCDLAGHLVTLGNIGRISQILQFGKTCLDKTYEKPGNYIFMAVLLQGLKRFYANMKELGQNDKTTRATIISINQIIRN